MCDARAVTDVALVLVPVLVRSSFRYYLPTEPLMCAMKAVLEMSVPDRASYAVAAVAVPATVCALCLLDRVQVAAAARGMASKDGHGCEAVADPAPAMTSA